jgi:hypothetical protein
MEIHQTKHLPGEGKGVHEGDVFENNIILCGSLNILIFQRSSWNDKV